MLKRLRNWWDSRFRPLKAEHFLIKSLITSGYARIDHQEEFRTCFPQRLEVFRLGGVLAKPIDGNLGLFITIRLYYHGNPNRDTCQYRFEWCFGKDDKFQELYDVKYGSEIFYNDPEQCQEEFNEIEPTLTSVILLHRLKSHADLTTPVEPSNLSEEELGRRWENWHESYRYR